MSCTGRASSLATTTDGTDAAVPCVAKHAHPAARETPQLRHTPCVSPCHVCPHCPYCEKSWPSAKQKHLEACQQKYFALVLAGLEPERVAGGFPIPGLAAVDQPVCVRCGASFDLVQFRNDRTARETHLAECGKRNRRTVKPNDDVAGSAADQPTLKKSRSEHVPDGEPESIVASCTPVFLAKLSSCPFCVKPFTEAMLSSMTRQKEHVSRCSAGHFAKPAKPCDGFPLDGHTAVDQPICCVCGLSFVEVELGKVTKTWTPPRRRAHIASCCAKHGFPLPLSMKDSFPLQPSAIPVDVRAKSKLPPLTHNSQRCAAASSIIAVLPTPATTTEQVAATSTVSGIIPAVTAPNVAEPPTAEKKSKKVDVVLVSQTPPVSLENMFVDRFITAHASTTGVAFTARPLSEISNESEVVLTGFLFRDGSCATVDRAGVFTYTTPRRYYFTVRSVAGCVAVPKILESKFRSLLWARDVFHFATKKARSSACKKQKVTDIVPGEQASDSTPRGLESAAASVRSAPPQWSVFEAHWLHHGGSATGSSSTIPVKLTKKPCTGPLFLLSVVPAPGGTSSGDLFPPDTRVQFLFSGACQPFMGGIYRDSDAEDAEDEQRDDFA